MKQIELRLIPAPGQPPEFLATLELLDKGSPVPNLWEQMPAVVILEGYTRDAWAMDTVATQWTQWQVESVDGRNKLPGFVKYLRDRQKTAYGRVMGGVMMWVISHKQMSSTTMNCRIAPVRKILNCPFVKANAAPSSNNSNKQHPPPSQGPKQVPPKTSTATSTAAATATAKPKKKGFGFLGNLVGAQRRTNQQVELASTVLPRKTTAAAPAAGNYGDSTNGNAAAGGSAPATNDGAAAAGSKTAGEVLAEFRQEMEQELLDFDLASDPSLKVKIDLAAKLRLLNDDEKQSGRVTMEVLKYIVYEQAEEVNEEWIAHKEPSEFMDEVTIVIYKEGEAPPEVLEDINKAELPDEIRGQQRAIQEQRQKAEQIKAQRLRMEQTKLALQKRQQQQGGDANANNDTAQDGEEEEEEEDFAALNTQKRDRRTIEDFEREAKRRRGE